MATVHAILKEDQAPSLLSRLLDWTFPEEKEQEIEHESVMSTCGEDEISE